MSHRFQTRSAGEPWIKVGRIAAAIAALAITSIAGAEDPKTRAQQLFKEGVEAMEKGQSAAGCAKLRESLELFAVANTLFLVAECEEQDGKLATALSLWQRGLALLDAKDKRAPKARERIAELEPKVPRLRVIVPPGQASTIVSLDGRDLAAGALEAPLPVDPGKHTLVFRAPGTEIRSRDIVLAPGERTEVVAPADLPAKEPPPADLPAKEPPPTGPPAKEPPPTGPPAQEPPPAGPPAKEAPSSNAGLRTGGFVALGIGGTALLAAGISGGIVLSRHSDAIKNCPEIGGVPTCPASYENQLGKDKALVVGNTVAWSVGIAGVATGAVLLLLSSRGSAKHSVVMPAPLVVARGTGLVFIGEL